MIEDYDKLTLEIHLSITVLGPKVDRNLSENPDRVSVTNL